MSSDDFNAPATSAGDPSLIPGVYNYCDHWCDRCRFQNRCLLYRQQRRLEAALEVNNVAGDDALDALLFEEEPEPTAISSASERASVLATLREFEQEPAEVDTQQAEARERRRRQFKDAHVLTVRTREYADLTHGIIRALRPSVEARADDVVLAALDTIERFAYTVAVKTWRATGALFDLADKAGDEGDDREWSQSDGNGCAKLVRLLIAESCYAWEVLMQIGRATADGVPAKMVERLEWLDAAIAADFPHAMQFVRPGFDEVDEGWTR